MSTFNEHIGERLREHFDLVKAGVPSEQALRIVCNENLEFNVVPDSMADIYRGDLMRTGTKINVTLDSLLQRLTLPQLDAVVMLMAEVPIVHPEASNVIMRLTGITRNGVKWRYEFEDAIRGGYCGVFGVKHMQVSEVLCMLDIVEQVLRVEPRNTQR